MAALRAFLAALLLAASLWTLTVTPAEACTCVSGISNDRIDRAERIVIGTTTDQRDVEPPPPLRLTLAPPATLEPLVLHGRRIETQLNVEEYVKGDGPTELTLVSAGTVSYGQDGEAQITPGSADCGFAPEIDARYLFMLRADDTDKNLIDTCRPLRIRAGDEVALARVDLIRYLAQSPEPKPTVDALPDTGSVGNGSDGDVFLSLIAVAGAGAVLLAALAGTGAAMLLAGVALRRRSR